MPGTKANALTVLKVRSIDELGDYSDGNGLTLRVGIPGFAALDHAIKDGEHLANSGSQCQPVLLARRREPLVVVADYGVVEPGYQCPM